jgi:hypothetical protein
MSTHALTQSMARVAEKAELLKLLPNDLLAAEPSAAMKRWLRYAFMSPLECTRQFARDYYIAYHSIFGIACDFEPEVNSGQFVVLWRMRQSADQWNVPYPLYLDVCFSFNRRNAEKFRRPHMHFDRLSNSVAWRKKFHFALRDHALSTIGRISDMPQLRREHFAGLPA